MKNKTISAHEAIAKKVSKSANITITAKCVKIVEEAKQKDAAIPFSHVGAEIVKELGSGENKAKS